MKKKDYLFLLGSFLIRFICKQPKQHKQFEARKSTQTSHQLRNPWFVYEKCFWFDSLVSWVAFLELWHNSDVVLGGRDFGDMSLGRDWSTTATGNKVKKRKWCEHESGLVRRREICDDEELRWRFPVRFWFSRRTEISAITILFICILCSFCYKSPELMWLYCLREWEEEEEEEGTGFGFVWLKKKWVTLKKKKGVEGTFLMCLEAFRVKW